MSSDCTPQVNPAWRSWTIWVPTALVVVGAAALIFGDLVGLVMGSWDSPAPGLHWLRIGIIGQCVLGAAGIGALVAGLATPARRRPAALVAWALFALELGWSILTARLASGDV